MSVDIREAQLRLLERIDRAERGEVIVISRNGVDVVQLVRVRIPAARRPGRMKGRIWMADDFDETPEEIIAAFEGDADCGRNERSSLVLALAAGL